MEKNYVIIFLIIYIVSFIPALFLSFLVPEISDFNKIEGYLFFHSLFLPLLLFFVLPKGENTINALSLIGFCYYGGEFVIKSLFPFVKDEFDVHLYINSSLYGFGLSTAIILLIVILHFAFTKKDSFNNSSRERR